jgi:RimJ/RimL family protein N-acetyltransferase
VLSLARDDGRTPKGEWDGPALLLQPVVPLLRDGLVTLRQLAISDATQLELNWQDQSAHTAGTNPVRDQALYYIRSTAPSGWLNGTAHTFAAADTATDVLLGTIDLHDFRPGAAEIGLSFGPQARGRGMAEAAARAIIDYGFEQLNLQYLFWRTLAPNWASRKLAWKLGFRSEARIRGYGIENGEPADLCILSLAKEEPRSPQNPWEGPEPPRSAAVD